MDADLIPGPLYLYIRTVFFVLKLCMAHYSGFPRIVARMQNALSATSQLNVDSSRKLTYHLADKATAITTNITKLPQLLGFSGSID